MNDNLIIEEIRKGDNKQLAVVYRTYRSEFITWLISNYQCTREEARDIYQITIVTLHENILGNKLQALTSNLKTYLFAIGKNKYHEFRRSENKIDRTVNAQSIELEQVSSWEKLEKERKLQVMEKSLEQLGDPCKTLLELYYFNGLSMEEIAKRVGYKNRDTAKNLKCKCIVRLRKIFHEQLQD